MTCTGGTAAAQTEARKLALRPLTTFIKPWITASQTCFYFGLEEMPMKPGKFHYEVANCVHMMAKHCGYKATSVKGGGGAAQIICMCAVSKLKEKFIAIQGTKMTEELFTATDTHVELFKIIRL